MNAYSLEGADAKTERYECPLESSKTLKGITIIFPDKQEFLKHMASKPYVQTQVLV